MKIKDLRNNKQQSKQLRMKVTDNGSKETLMRISGKMRKITDLVTNGVIQTRAELSGALGKSYGTTRDLYKALGYKKQPTFQDYYDRYERQDIAKAIVDIPVTSSWRLYPTIKETQDQEKEGEETQFEESIGKLIKESKMFHYLSRVDRLSGIGQYAVLLVGYNDGSVLKEEVKSASEILYLQTYNEDNAKIEEWDVDEKSPRYGLPLVYQLKVTNPDRSSRKTIEVHHTRVLHVSEGLLESDVFGSSRLKSVLNRLQDLDLIMGGSAEMFWRGAFPGFGVMAKEGVSFMDDAQSLADFETELDSYFNNLQRYFRIEGADIKEMHTQVADPTNHVDVQLTAISAARRIPKRILIGSERGQLASEQDETAWNTSVDERRRNYIEPMMLRPFIDMQIERGVLPDPVGGYVVEWPDLFVTSEEDKAKVSKTKSESIAIYSNSVGADQVVPPEIFLSDIMGFSEDKIKQIQDMVAEVMEEEEENIKEENEIMKKELADRNKSEGIEE